MTIGCKVQIGIVGIWRGDVALPLLVHHLRAPLSLKPWKFAAIPMLLGSFPPKSWHGASHQGQASTEVRDARAVQGALLLALFTISHTLEHYLTERAQGDMSSLFSQVPKQATLITK